jgi:ABC-type glycerol-3-phosphate transport system substrate-binding protein
MMKMNKNRSYWRELIVLILILSLTLVSCTPADPTPRDNSSDETPEPTQTSTTTETPQAIETESTPVHLDVNGEDLAGVVVRFAHPWAGALVDTIEDLAARFSMTNEWDVWVEVESFGGKSGMMSALSQDAAEGDLPGLIVAYPYELAMLEEDVFTVNLNPYFENPDWGLNLEAMEDIPAVFLDQFRSENALVALPVAPQATVNFYNQTWAEELGFGSLPETIEDFRYLSCEAVFANNEDRIEDNDGTGGWLVNFEPAVLASWYAVFGGELPVNGFPNFDTEAGGEAFGTLKEAYDQGCFWIGRQPEPYFYFANRYALAYAGTLDQIPVQMGWMVEAENEDVWRVMGFPGPEGEAILVDGPGLMITADSPENQMAAWLFVRYLLEPEVQAELVRSGFTLPVRGSAMELLSDFSVAYPQWAQAAAMIDMAQPLPISQGWAVARYLLQDAMVQFIRMEIEPPSSISSELSSILQQLDAEIIELEGMAP